MAGMAVEAVAFGLWSPQLLAQTYVPGHTLIDPLFVLGLLMIAAGGTLSARRVETAPEINEPARTGGVVPGVNSIGISYCRCLGSTSALTLLNTSR